MAKKNFQSAPRPKSNISSEAIDSFVNCGVGNDSRTEKNHLSTKHVQEEGQKKRLSVDLPQSMHLRFKTACSATQRKMTKEIEAFISKRTNELEKEANINQK